MPNTETDSARPLMRRAFPLLIIAAGAALSAAVAPDGWRLLSGLGGAFWIGALVAVIAAPAAGGPARRLPRSERGQ